MKKILVLNSGSSSLKYQLFNVDGDKYEVVAKGLAERIGIDGSCVSIKFNGDKKVKEVNLPSHTEAINEVFKLLSEGALNSMDELTAVGHRVVHGGEAFAQSLPKLKSCQLWRRCIIRPMYWELKLFPNCCRIFRRLPFLIRLSIRQ